MAIQDIADSFALWWREAGLHSLTSPQPHGWRERVAQPAPTPVARPAAAPAAPAASARAAQRPMPRELTAFRSWLGEDPAQPEAVWTGPVCLPPATAQARLLVLTDMPDADAHDPAQPFAPATQRFLAAMLGAIGLQVEDVAIAPLAMRRPPGGLLDDATHAALVARMQHYLALARPRAALILGDRTSRALLAARDGNRSEALPDVHHAGGIMPAAALPGLAHLMRRPTAKAASWQTLRLLTGVIAA